MNKLREIFRTKELWIDKKLTDSNPCDKCDIYRDCKTKALYGSIAERQYAELPESCNVCMDKLYWEIDCKRKLAWYENNDERLNKSNQY